MAWNEDVQLWRTPNGIFLAPSDKMTLSSKYAHTSFNRLRAIGADNAANVADVAKLGMPFNA
jgi:hypothetical protein